MGSTFSTRWNLVPVRPVTEGLLSLDVRWLKRVGALEADAVRQPTWRQANQPWSSITTRCESNRLILDYTVTLSNTAPQSMQDLISLDTTPCHFGGARCWFRCPECRRRRAVLFSAGGVFRCRSCHGLAYSSTREDAMDRTHRTIRKLQQRLGAALDTDLWYIPGKPPRMHWRTYECLSRQLYDAIAEYEMMFAERASRLFKRVDGPTVHGDWE